MPETSSGQNISALKLSWSTAVRYTLRAKTRDGSTLTVGDGVRGVAVARHLEDLIAKGPGFRRGFPADFANLDGYVVAR